MNGKKEWFGLVLAVSLLGLSTLACTMNKVIKATETPPPTAGSSSYAFSGSGTDTWIWEGGKYTCDAQEEMKLTIDNTGYAALTVRGACLSLSNVGDPAHYESGKCDQGAPDVKCGVVVYGFYNPDDRHITFTACNNINIANGSGTAILSPAPNSNTEMQVSGAVTCTFSNGGGDHELNFTLP
jgi:hypothetical protein